MSVTVTPETFTPGDMAYIVAPTSLSTFLTLATNIAADLEALAKYAGRFRVLRLPRTGRRLFLYVRP